MSYMNNLTGFWDLSEINSQNICPATTGSYNATGTGLASSNILRNEIGYGTRFNGTDEKTAMGDVGTVRSISFLVSPDTTTEELILLDTGKDIMVSAGTITYTGVTASATYVDGEASTTLVAGKLQHVVCVLNADVDANTFELATDGTNFGAVLLDEVAIFTSALTNLQSADIFAQLRNGSPSSWRIQNNSPFLKFYAPLNNHARDLVGGNDGTWTNEAYTEGPYGRSVGDFDGSSYITTGTKYDIDGNSFSIGYCLKLETDGSRGGMFQRKESGTYQGVLLGKVSGSNIIGRVIDTSGTDLTVSYAQSLNNWVHYLITYNNTAKTLTMYADGKHVGSDTDVTFTGVMTISEHENMQFMSRNNGSAVVTGESFNFKFFGDICLTGDEVLDLWMQERNS